MKRRLTPADILQMEDATYRALLAGSDTPLAAAVRACEKEVDDQDIEALRTWLLREIEDLDLLSALDRSEERRQQLLRYIRKWVARMEHHGGRLSPTEAVVEYLYARACGLGPLEKLLQDPDVTEITVQAADRVIVQHRGQRRVAPDVRFPGGDGEVLGWIRYLAGLAGQLVNHERPQASFTLRDGSRVTVTVPPVGISLSLRRKRAQAWTLEDWIEAGSISREAADWLKRVFESGRLGVLFAGGSGTGKTSLLEALIRYVPPGNVLLVQENAEIHEDVHPTLTVMMADPRFPRGPRGLRAIASGAMLQAPTFVVIGEVRGPEVVAAIMAVDAGTGGAASTCHAQSAADAYAKLEAYCLEDEGYRAAGVEAIRAALVRTFPVCVHLRRTRTGRVYVAEILQAEAKGGTLCLVETFCGEELQGGEIAFRTGPGTEAPIERVAQELQLLPMPQGETVTLPEAHAQAVDLYRQAIAAGAVGDYAQGIGLLEKALALVPDRQVEQLLEEYRIQVRAWEEGWQERLEQLRVELEEAEASNDEARVRDVLSLIDTIGGAAAEREALRARAEAWLARRERERMEERRQALESTDSTEVLSWGEWCWRRGEDGWAVRFFRRALELGAQDAQIYLDALGGRDG